MSTVRRDYAHPLHLHRENRPSHPIPEGASARGGLLSIVVPAKDEAANLPQLVNEIVRAFRPLAARPGGPHKLDGFEVVIVDDGSTDGTAESTATVAGFRASRGDWIGLLDADLQNPPADLAAMWDALPGFDAALGWRQDRQDKWSRRVLSRLANGLRNLVLGQAIRDTGCSVRIIARDLALRLPMFHGGHRFLGPLLLREGCRIVQMPVAHRPRARGKSHYHFGNRSVRVVVDLLGVAWLLRRPIRYEVVVPGTAAPDRPAQVRLMAGREAAR